MANNKYINYNLSLVDPDNLKIPSTPIERKDEEIDLSVENTKERKNERRIIIPVTDDEKIELDVSTKTKRSVKEKVLIAPEEISENKEDFDISTFIQLDGKMTEAEETNSPEVDKWDILLAKEFPLDTIDPEFKTHVMKEEAMETDTSLLDFANEKAPMENFHVNEANMGKDIVRQKTSEEFKTNFDVNILDQEYEKTKSRKSPPRYITKSLKETDKGKDDSVNIMDISPFTRSRIIKTPYHKKELTYIEALKKVNAKEQVSNLGALHVYPINPNTEGGISAKYIIPFEFNPKITENGTSAKYESISLLSRIGDIHSYIKTDSNTIQLNTKYQVLSSGEEYSDGLAGDHNKVGSWMEAFTLRNLQSIEMAFRGLVYPQTSKEAGSFFRPPVIKIVFGNANKASEGQTVNATIPFNNMLTYPYKISNNETKIYHKNFIVSKIDIRKDWDNYPLILNENNDGIIDIQGFDVSLSLLEIDPMYIGILPSFEDYYSIVPTLTEV